MPSNESTPYRVTQYAYPDPGKPPRNIGVTDLASLVTHHPFANRHARIVDGVPRDAENARSRSYGLVGGVFQEVQVLETDRKYRSLAPDQVLLIKDFILDDPTARDSRSVDVPAPVAGIVGRVDAPNGVVDIVAPGDRALVARIRHLGPIAVAPGDAVAYGQSLGTQNSIGLPHGAGKHVHIEMDTRYHREFDGYIRDLVEGRLPVQAGLREGVEPRPVPADGVLRVGESGERVALLQRALAAGGYREVGGVPVTVDGVYRLSMQGAVLAFQVDQGLEPTADIDPATWRAALEPALGRPVLPPEAFDPGDRAGPLRPGFRLLEQIRGHMRGAALPAAAGSGSGIGPGIDAELVALALAGRAAARGLAAADHVVFAPQASGGAQPARVLVVQGRLDDPAQRRVSMRFDEALAIAPKQSLCALQALEPDLPAHRAGALARGAAAPMEPCRTAFGV